MLRSRNVLLLILLPWSAAFAFPHCRADDGLNIHSPGKNLSECDRGQDRPIPRKFIAASLVPIDLSTTSTPDKGEAAQQTAGAPLIGAALPPGPREISRDDIDGAIAKNPRDAALLAIRLGFFSDGVGMDRDDNPLSNDQWPKPLFSVKSPADQAAFTQAWLHRLDLANQGAALEPENSYFDWARLAALFALHRDAEVASVLDAAGKKTGYDSHARDKNLTALDAYEGAPPATPNQQYGAAELFSGSSWTLSQKREVARQVVWQIIQDRSRGQNQVALTAADGFLKMSELFRDAGYGLIDPLVAVAIDHLVILGVGDRFTSSGVMIHNPPVNINGPLPQTGRNLAAFALENNRPDIARDAETAWDNDRNLLSAIRSQKYVAPGKK